MKKLLTLALTAIFVLSTAACGGPAAPAAPAPVAPAPAQDAPADAPAQEDGAAADPFADAPSFRLMLAENQPYHNPISQGMMMFSELVYEKTNGTVYVDVFLDGQLGTEDDTVVQLRAGTLDMSRVNVAAITPVADAMGVFMLPFIFADDDHKYRVLDGPIGQELGAHLEEYGLVFLEYWEAGSRNFYTSNTPIRSVADMQGMMVRVQPVEVALRMVEALGAAAVPIPFPDVYTALQTGVVDGAENDFVSYYTAGHFEVARYFSLTGHMSPPAMVVMSAQTWNQLIPAQQEAVRAAAREAVLWQRQAMMDFQLESRDRVVAAGTEIIEVDVREFQEAMAEVYALYPQHADRIDAILALVN